VDHSFEWEKTYDYFVTVVSIVTEPGKPKLEIEGDDSPAVRVFAHDIFPPAVPNGLQAVFAAEGQQRFIDLIWAPDTDADLAGYNVYRREANGEALRINPALVTTPAYRDVNVEPGKEYFYSVSAVDVRGNESARSEEASEKVPQ
jgi:fibronectin type 3 domain-containing protein